MSKEHGVKMNLSGIVALQSALAPGHQTGQHEDRRLRHHLLRMRIILLNNRWLCSENFRSESWQTVFRNSHCLLPEPGAFSARYAVLRKKFYPMINALWWRAFLNDCSLQDRNAGYSPIVLGVFLFQAVELACCKAATLFWMKIDVK